MKKTTKLISLVMALALVLALFAGCGSQTAPAETPAATPAPAESAEPTPEATPEEPADVTVNNGTTWSVTHKADGSMDVVDMWGNTVTLPGTVEKIYSSSPIGTYMNYVIDPEIMVGWNSQLSDEALQYINPDYRDMQVLGGSMVGSNTVDTEYVNGLEPDVNVAYGAVGGSISDTIKTLSETTGIPVLFLDSALLATSDALRFLGELTGRTERANELADYADAKLEACRALAEASPEDARKTVYYASSEDGLSTAGSNSMHTEVLALLGVENVIGEDESYTGGNTVSLEQVLAWDPDVIISRSDAFYAGIYDNADWSGITAVADKAVYNVPSMPFNWFDKPPCIARVIGTEWVLYKMYPEYVDFDMTQEVIDFYKLFYQVNITAEQAEALIG